MSKSRFQKPAFTKNRLFRFLATIKFAIPALFVFAGAMIYGTVCESLYGTTYATRAVYQTVWFYAIVGAICLSLILSMIDRIPAKKRQIGFFIVHISLLTIMGGALVTRIKGVDGSIELSKDEFRASVKLGEDRLILTDGKQEYSPKLPASTSSKEIKGIFNFIDGSQATLVKFIPFAKQDVQMSPKEGAWSSRWLLANDRFQLPLNLTLGAEGVPSRISEGLLTVEVLSETHFTGLSKALTSQSPDGRKITQNGNIKYLLFTTPNGDPKAIQSLANPINFSVGSASLKLERAYNKKADVSFFRLTSKSQSKEVLHFIPRYSPEPFSGHLETLPSSPYRFYDLEELRKKPTVLLTKTKEGNVKFAFGKSGNWTLADFKGEPVTLPWMGFKLTLLSDFGSAIPEVIYSAATPHKEDEKNIKAALVQIQKNGKAEDFWVTNQKGAHSQISSVQGMIGPEEFYLPFQMKLERFKMDLIPGTDKPASYESFVQIKDTSEVAHVFMNNPLKKEGYTLYQASYFQDEQNEYHSVLSVNRDPGRPIKYLGSGLLVLGLILHFLIIYGYLKFKEA